MTCPRTGYPTSARTTGHVQCVAVTVLVPIAISVEA